MPEENTNSGAGDQTGGQGGGGGAGGQTGTQTGGTDDGKGGKDQLLADLARERDRRQTAEREAKRIEQEFTKLREGSMSEQEKAVEAARREAKAEASKGFNSRLIQAEVRATAAGKLTDPEDAIRFLDLAEFAIDDDGKVDKKAITKALEDLVKAKPYLAASATRPTGDADQGARGSQAGSTNPMNALIKNAVNRR